MLDTTSSRAVPARHLAFAGCTMSNFWYNIATKGCFSMPAISKFYGLIIRMYFDDKHLPHFHAGYAEYRALIAIQDGSLIAGRLPQRAYRLALEWAALHRDELLANWERARRQETLEWIEGLE
jgi:hypothetical protein